VKFSKGLGNAKIAKKAQKTRKRKQINETLFKHGG
jgi:hypothetical protein